MIKKTTLVLAMLFMAWATFAQRKGSRTEYMFNPFVNARSYNGCLIVSNPEANLEIRVVSLKDVEMFRNLDSIVKHCVNELSVFKDSLKGDKKICVDFYFEGGDAGTKLRIKRHAQNGDIFWKKGDDIGKLKMEKDTLNILLNHQRTDAEKNNKKISFVYSVVAQIIVDDINELPGLMKKGLSFNIGIDSCYQRLNKEVENGMTVYFEHPFTVAYNKSKNGLQTVDFFRNTIDDTLHGQNAIQFTTTHHPKTDRLVLGGNVGAGLIQNTIAPFASADLTIIHDYRRDNAHFFATLSTSAYFNFDKQGDQTFIHKSLFVNIEMGRTQDKNYSNWLGNNLSLGLGYLYKNEGRYFGKNTFKLFTTVQIKNGVSLEPSLIMTNNFQQFYPGLTLKIF